MPAFFGLSLFFSPLSRIQTVGFGTFATLALFTATALHADTGRTATVQNASKVNQKIADTSGTMRVIPAPGAKATVLIFISHDCPISNVYAPEISRIASDYAERQVQLVVVYAESEFSAAKAREHASQYKYHVPTVVDATHRLSRATGATVTPDAVVLGPDGRRLYRGRIDNRYFGFGKKRAIASERNLRDALDAVLANKPVATPQTTAIGCFIPTS